MGSLLDIDGSIIDWIEQHAVLLVCAAVLIVTFGLLGEAVRRAKRSAADDEG